MNKRRIGGLAKTVTMTLDELGQSLERVQQLGFDLGVDYARKSATDEIRAEIESETRDCPMCEQTRHVQQLQLDLEIVRQDRDELRRKARGWAIRNGRAAYRSTRVSGDGAMSSEKRALRSTESREQKAAGLRYRTDPGS